MSYRREITTLGRGGSDTTALAMAAALKAERAEIYSDVDGVYSADPRVVPEATHIPEIDYAEMQEMADAGAKVLHAGAVEFASRARIRIHARATFAPGRETVVGATAAQARGPWWGCGQWCACGRPNDSALRHAQKAAEAGHLPVIAAELSDGPGSFLVDTRHAPDWPKVEHAVREAVGPGGVLESGFAVATVVGAWRAATRSECAMSSRRPADDGSR
jgi:aspartate kinase